MATATNADWIVLEDDEIVQIIKYAASSVANKFGLDRYDMEQDAYLVVATTPALCERACDGEYGLFQYELIRDLTDIARTQARRANKAVPYNAEAQDERDATVQAVVTETGSEAYDRELVQALIPAIWDDAYAYGMRAEDTPDVDMPRAGANKSRGNTLWAHLADIHIAWETAPLTDEERRALVLHYGMGWEHEEIGFNQGVSRQRIGQRLSSAVSKLVTTINGN